MPNWTAEQQRAIDANGNLLVSAGAGSGKTAVLTARIVRLIRGGESINSVLCVTLTNAAAAEMKKRIEKSLARAAAEAGRPLPDGPVRAARDRGAAGRPHPDGRAHVRGGRGEGLEGAGERRGRGDAAPGCAPEADRARAGREGRRRSPRRARARRRSSETGRISHLSGSRGRPAGSREGSAGTRPLRFRSSWSCSSIK